VRLGQGRGKGVASPTRRGSALEKRRPLGARVGHGWMRGRGGRFGSGPIGALSFSEARRGRHLPLDGTEHGRGEKREGVREGSGFKLNFLKISNRNLKNFEHESSREFENLQLLF
jgi:hypothetical protein